VGSCRDDRFSDNVGKVGSDDEIHRKSRCKECRSSEKTSAHPEKTSENTYDKSDENQVNRIEMNTGDGKKHRAYGPLRRWVTWTRADTSRSSPTA
jgi:hypothetical protein